MTARVTGQRFRQRKLSTKQNLPVLREKDIEQLADDDATRHIPKVETGVEKGEEIVSLLACRLLHHASPLSARRHVIGLSCVLHRLTLPAPVAN
jgi:predicted ATP-grasp superfamily ATP-dependent carboligase